MEITAKQIESLIEKIHTFSLPEDDGGNTRLTLSPEDMAARKYVMGEMEKIGLAVSVDAVGNITGRAAGTEPSLPEVWTGSHIDTVVHGGKYDGVAGVVSGLEALRTIIAERAPHKRNICLKIYTGEEGSKFSGGCIGSRVIAGHLTKEDLDALSDGEGHTVGGLLRENGFPFDQFDAVRKTARDIYASVELHIEQGGNLEKAHKVIGIVDGICAPTNMILHISGEQGHAGGMPMKDRRDAFMAAAEMALALEDCALHGTSAYTTGTVGLVEVSPNAENVVPGKVRMSADVRDCEKQSKDLVVKNFLSKVHAIAEKRHVKAEVFMKRDDTPHLCDPSIQKLIEKAAEKEHVSYMHTFSGPCHDSLLIAEIAPVGMIFVPSRGGISHSPKEWTSCEDIAKGARVLKDVILALANQ